MTSRPCEPVLNVLPLLTKIVRLEWMLIVPPSLKSVWLLMIQMLVAGVAGSTPRDVSPYSPFSAKMPLPSSHVPPL